MKYRWVVLGGTFDQIHKGHEALLTKAFGVGDTVIIGLTSDLYVKRFKIHPSAGGLGYKIQDFRKRKQQLETWLKGHFWEKRALIQSIDGPYGPTVKSKELEAIVVSTESAPRVLEINAHRIAAGLPPLDVVTIPMVLSEDLAAVSSTRVRKKEIDASGNLVLPDNLRLELRKPMGGVLTSEKLFSSIEKQKGRVIIAVGDMTTKTILDAGITPHLSIIDGKVGRQPFADAEKGLRALAIPLLYVKSGPGYISQEAIGAIKKAMGSLDAEKHQAIIVDGEEDLLVLPVVLYGPVGSAVYYGQPGEGIVEVAVTDVKKYSVDTTLQSFRLLI